MVDLSPPLFPDTPQRDVQFYFETRDRTNELSADEIGAIGLALWQLRKQPVEDTPLWGVSARLEALASRFGS